MNRILGVSVAAVAVVATAAVAGCSSAIEGSAVADPVAKAAHDECVRTTDDAAGAVTRYLAELDTLDFTARLDRAPLRNMRAACNTEVALAYSDFLVRIKDGFKPAGFAGTSGLKVLMLQLCRDDSVVGVQRDELTEAAQQACRDS